jgi:hypothetical protein
VPLSILHHLPTSIFLHDQRELAKTTGLKSLTFVLRAFNNWIEENILHRQASKDLKKTISAATATTTGGCPMHPGEAHRGTVPPAEQEEHGVS